MNVKLCKIIYTLITINHNKYFIKSKLFGFYENVEGLKNKV